MGQPVEVSVDALPGKVFCRTGDRGREPPVCALPGIATSQSTTGTEEAKDFKVVVTLPNPPPELRPGLSATAKITTARRQNVLAIPIQALAMRTAASLKGNPSMRERVNAASTGDGALPGRQDPGTQGVLVLAWQAAEWRFAPVAPDITGTTDIEVPVASKPGTKSSSGPTKCCARLRTMSIEAR